MGMESFRVDMYFKDNITLQDVINKISESYKIEQHYFMKRFSFRKEYLNKEYRINDFIIMYCSVEDKYLCFEACFSNYNKYLMEIYRIFMLLCEEFDIKIKMDKFELDKFVYYNTYEQEIMSFYKNKYRMFFGDYNLNDIDMLCGQDFYRRINMGRFLKIKRKTKNFST